MSFNHFILLTNVMTKLFFISKVIFFIESSSISMHNKTRTKLITVILNLEHKFRIRTLKMKKLN